MCSSDLARPESRSLHFSDPDGLDHQLLFAHVPDAPTHASLLAARSLVEPTSVVAPSSGVETSAAETEDARA